MFYWSLKKLDIDWVTQLVYACMYVCMFEWMNLIESKMAWSISTEFCTRSRSTCEPIMGTIKSGLLHPEGREDTFKFLVLWYW